MQKLLIKLAQPFVDLDFITTTQAICAIEQILKLPFVASLPHVKNLKALKIEKSKMTPSLDTHLKNINDLRSLLLTTNDGELWTEN